MSNQPLFYCVNCGTIRTCERITVVPALVESLIEMARSLRIPPRTGETTPADGAP